MKPSWVIHQNRLEDAVALLRSIPEFESMPTIENIRQRIGQAPHLILTAHDGDKTIGTKIGYLRDESFYSWLGAIHPAYRQRGIADALVDEQENWALAQGYNRIWMKTRNCYPEMLIMAVRRGFKITSMDIREDFQQNRIILEKNLNAVLPNKEQAV